MTIGFWVLPGIAADPKVEKDANVLYSPNGKRDPFKPPNFENQGRTPSSIKPLEKFSVQQFELKAILRGIGVPKAMFRDPNGRIHILEEGDVLGRERATLSRIANSDVIVTEKTTNYLGEESLYERVLSLPTEDILNK